MSARHFDDNQSVWLAGKKPYTASPPLAGKLDVDVAIIGGGFTGVSTAYHLNARFPNKAVAILEARTLANGASGRNGGQMLNWVHGVDPEEPERARQIYDATQDGIDTVLSIIAEHGLDVPHDQSGHVDMFTDSKNADAAAEAAERWERAGLPVRFLEPKELGSLIAFDNTHGGLFDPRAGYLDGAAFLRELKPVLERRGVQIFENSVVSRIREGRVVELETEGGSVRADAIVLATNAYTPHLGYFRSGIVPVHSHVLATEPADPTTWSGLGFPRGLGFTDDRDRLSYGTLIGAPGTSRRLIFGGGSNEAYDYRFGNGTRYEHPSENAARANRRQLLSYFPSLRDVEISHRWSGAVALTLSRLCTMGVRGAHRNVYYAVGYSGHGVTLANLAGKILTDIYSDADERWRALPFFQQRLRYIPPEPFRFVGYHAYTRLVGRSPRAS